MTFELESRQEGEIHVVKCEMLVKIASFKQWKQEEMVCFLE
jgi:hypothetical protein